MSWSRRTRLVSLAVTALLLGGAACLAATPALRSALARHSPFASASSAAPADAERCAAAPGEAPLRYAQVAQVFVKHCDRCHHQAQSDNLAARRVFESSSYPFSTERPDALLVDLRAMFESRGGLSDEERCVALRWVDGGGLDDSGAPPAWRR